MVKSEKTVNLSLSQRPISMAHQRTKRPKFDAVKESPPKKLGHTKISELVNSAETYDNGQQLHSSMMLYTKQDSGVEFDRKNQQEIR